MDKVVDASQSYIVAGADSGINLENIGCDCCGSHDNDLIVESPDRMVGKCPDLIFRVVRCRKCGLCFQNPRPALKDLPSLYPSQYYSYQPIKQKVRHGLKAFGYSFEMWSKRAMRQAFFGYPVKGGDLVRLMLQTIFWPLYLRLCLLAKDIKIIPYRGQGRFLDIGCGAGRDLLFQRDFGLRVAGVELNDSAARIARDCYGLDVRAGTLQEVGFDEGSFDIVHMSHVLEHLPSPSGTLSEIHRILSPEGVLIIKVPNMDSSSSSKFGAYWLGLDVPRHLYHFSPVSISSLLIKQGFVVEKIKYDLGAWGYERESRRLRLLDEKQEYLKDSRSKNLAYKFHELLACLKNKGSVMAVYARKRT